jgi:rRNA maturation endonuclease Nob1
MVMRIPGERLRMVQFCPKCGTKAPDDQSAFCNKCGTRLPPVIPEKPDIICPRCGIKFPDAQSVFCNKCGSPLQRVSPVPIQQAAVRPAVAVPPVMKKKSCPSCGAPLVDEISEFCNICGAGVHGPVPGIPVREPPRPSPETMAPTPLTPTRPVVKKKSCPSCGVPLVDEKADRCDSCGAYLGVPVTDSPGVGEDQPVQDKGRRFLKWGLIGIVLIIILVAAAAVIPGMISGTNQSVTTPTPATEDIKPVTTLPTQKITKTATPTRTTTPAKVTTTAAKANASTTVTSNTSTIKPNTSATVAMNGTVNATTNTTRTATPTPSATISSQPYSLGQSASDGKARLTVNSITFKDKMSDPIPSYAIGKKYLIVDITFENLQNETVEINTGAMLVKDGGGYAFEPVTNDVMLENPLYVIGRSVLSQEKKTGNMLFIVPPGATYLKFQYDFGNQNIATFQLN